MGLEIERKFLVTSNAWRLSAPGVRYRQGYLSSRDACTVRVRVAGEQAFLTLKGKAEGIARPEFEYEIPVSDAEAILSALCPGPLIDKTRHLVLHAGHSWEIDVFHGDNAGLVLAELELERPDELFEKPAWLGLEVTSDPRYQNARLAERPFQRWPASERRA